MAYQHGSSLYIRIAAIAGENHGKIWQAKASVNIALSAAPQIIKRRRAFGMAYASRANGINGVTAKCAGAQRSNGGSESGVMK